MDDGAAGDQNDFVFTGAAGFVISAALFAVLGFNMRVIGQFQQGGQVAFGADDDVSPFAAVAPVGAAKFYKFFSSKREAAVTAFSGGYVNFYTV